MSENHELFQTSQQNLMDMFQQMMTPAGEENVEKEIYQE